MRGLYVRTRIEDLFPLGHTDAILNKSLYLPLFLKVDLQRISPTLPLLSRYYHIQVTASQVEKAETKYNGQVLDFFCLR